MKKLILSFVVLAAVGMSNVNATTKLVDETTIAAKEEGKTAIKITELPEPVQKALAGEEYKGWTASSAFLVKGKDGASQYQVELKNGEQVKTLTLDATGKQVN